MSNENKELERYLATTPRSRALWDEAREYLPGGDSRNSIFWNPYPVFIESGSGCHVVDVDGVDRLDFINTMTSLILGHSPRSVVHAVTSQLEKGVVYNAPNRHQITLAKLLCDRVPSFDLVRFTNSGTEATLNTIRAARAFTGKNRIAKAEGGYHGTHDVVTVSVAASEGVPQETVDQVTVIPFNETEAALKILEGQKDTLAAVIVEPMLGSVGMVPATPEFLAMLRKFTSEHGIVLIFDEVISFRVAPGGAQQFYDVTPDLASLGKIIGGGFAVGAFGGRAEIMELYDPTKGPRVSHAGTFNANPVTMAAGSATLEELTPEVYRRLAELTDRLKLGIQNVCAALEVPVQTTGLGSLFGIHFNDQPMVNYRSVSRGDSRLRDQVFLGLLNEGILMASNLVGAMSTALEESDVDAFLDSFQRVLERR